MSLQKNNEFLNADLIDPVKEKLIHKKHTHKRKPFKIHNHTHKSPFKQTSQKASFTQYIQSLLSKTKIKLASSSQFGLGNAYLGFFIPIVDSNGKLIFQHARKYFYQKRSNKKSSIGKEGETILQ